MYAEWRDCISIMANRIIKMRTGLRERLEKLGTPGSWRYIYNIYRVVISFVCMSDHNS